MAVDIIETFCVCVCVLILNPRSLLAVQMKINFCALAVPSYKKEV